MHTESELIDMYRYLVTGRRMAQSFGTTRKDWHSVEGEEAVVVGSFYGLRLSDVASPHYRGCELVSYMRGESLASIYAGILGKATSKSFGRHKNEFCGPFELNIIGLYSGVLGPNICYGAGAALAMKLKQTDDVVVVSFGDGTANRGDFHETLRTAAMLDLPAVFICQNNQYAISMPSQQAFNQVPLSKLGEGYGIPTTEVDGMDVLAVNEAVRYAVNRARRGGGPCFIDALTCRFSGHWVSDPEQYRPEDEVEKMRERDPIEIMRAQLREQAVISDKQMEEIELSINREVNEAAESAKNDPVPTPQHLGVKEVYAEV